MEPDVNRVLEKARRGDTNAASDLIELFYARIYAFLRRFSGNDADAADLTQRTFSRVWNSLESFAARSAVSSWIHGIAYHVYVDWRRAERRAEPRSDEWWNLRPDSATRPDEAAARSDLSTAVYASVDRLAPDLRDTIHLHYYQGLTIEETAEALGVATSTVKYRQRQALAELQKQFATERSVLL
jgi:RNA polymerase sigma-70 factor (ECF subfamily)